MASDICLKDQFVWVSNERLSTLLAFALQVGGQEAQSAEERDWIEKLLQFKEHSFPGIGFDLGERFSTVDEKKFWARVFHDVARRIFLRELGNQEITFWQSSTIGDAYIVARMLTRAVQEIDNAWHPKTENAQESERLNGRINLRI